MISFGLQGNEEDEGGKRTVQGWGYPLGCQLPNPTCALSDNPWPHDHSNLSPSPNYFPRSGDLPQKQEIP